MAIDNRAGNKVVKNARREDAAGTRVDPYPYIGIIKNNLDPTRSGRLQVYIPDLGGPEDDPKNWRTVSYTSPFMGYTSQTQSSTDRPSQENKFGTVHHTYGMWMIPPDIGVQIIVIFVAGDPLRGYGISCVNPHLSHYMMPGLAGTQNVDQTSLTPGQRKQIKDGDIVPVVEFNEYTSDFTNNAFYNNNKPLHTYQYSIYQKQGLEKDIVRGPLSSSSQRESPSYVFGISTPGRPVNDPADDPNYIANLIGGKLDPKYTTVKSRKGGHVFVMDDGSTTGTDQLIRLRSAGGHQILLHDSNESLYIAHANGYSWVELTKDGKILAYSKKGMAVRTEGNFDFRADGDLNIDVGGKINIKAGNSLKLETPLIEFLAENKFSVTANSTAEFKVGAFKVDSTGKIGLKAGGIVALEGSSIKQNSGGTDSLKAVSAIQANKLPDVTGSGGVWTSKPGALETIVKIAPTHEPYDRGTKAVAFVPESPGIQPGTYSDPVDQTTAPETQTAGVSDPAQTKDIRNQPAALGPIGNLSQEQVTALFAQIGKSESGGNYNTTNQLGYVGKYQFGWPALLEGGYVKSTVKSNNDLQNPNSWTGKNGISSVQDWMSNGTEQETAMFNLTKRNYTSMCNNGAVTTDQKPEEVGGMLMTAHLLGAGGANKWRKGGGGADANGTSGETYFNKGKYAVAVLAPKMQSVNAG
jgi:hypothetical protein